MKAVVQEFIAILAPVAAALAAQAPYPPGADGLAGEEGTFNMCSFWLVEALTSAGQANPEKLEEARIIFERMLGYATTLASMRSKPASRVRLSEIFPRLLPTWP